MHRPTKSPVTTGMMNGAKSEQAKRILTHTAHALCAIFLSVHPAIYGALIALAWELWHGI